MSSRCSGNDDIVLGPPKLTFASASANARSRGNQDDFPEKSPSNSNSVTGFDDDKEGTGPCGSFDETTRTPLSDFQVGGSAISVLSTHPSATWFINGALLSDLKAGKNFTALDPPIAETGMGNFCLPQVKVPSEWEGQDGVIQVQQQGHDGLLFQVCGH